MTSPGSFGNSTQKNCKLSLASILQWECCTSHKYGITGQQVKYWPPHCSPQSWVGIFFFKILRYLHLVDSAKHKKKGEEGYDILYKVRPLIDHLAAVFPKYYQPSRNISIDEMMISTRCHLSFLQLIPKKLTRFGIKVWVRMCRGQFRICSGFPSIYWWWEDGQKGFTWSQSCHETHGTITRERSLCLVIDNFYTSLSLLLDLLDLGTHCAGTVWTNRKTLTWSQTKHMPLVLSGLQCVSKKHLLLFGGRIGKMFTWWVLCITYPQPRYWKDQKVNVRKSPPSVPLPLRTIISIWGVDLADQLLSYYSMSTRCILKWWKKVFWRLINVTIINSWIIFHLNNPDSQINSQNYFTSDWLKSLCSPSWISDPVQSVLNIYRMLEVGGQ